LVKAALAACAVWAAAAGAQASDCRLALLLALDVSSSVDDMEDGLQRNGLAAALIAPEVQEAFFSSPLPVAMAIYEWSGRYNQVVLADWRLIEGPGDLVTLAETLARSRRSSDEFPTAMGYALGYGARMLERGPDCLFRTIDLSGDGENNEGFPPSAAYREFPFRDVTVNGLVINAADFEGELTLLDYFRREVLHGPGAFLEVAYGYGDYETAMRRKLRREVTARELSAVRGNGQAPG
jgi:hypothetical protein